MGEKQAPTGTANPQVGKLEVRDVLSHYSGVTVLSSINSKELVTDYLKYKQKRKVKYYCIFRKQEFYLKNVSIEIQMSFSRSYIESRKTVDINLTLYEARKTLTMEMSILLSVVQHAQQFMVQRKQDYGNTYSSQHISNPDNRKKMFFLELFLNNCQIQAKE